MIFKNLLLFLFLSVNLQSQFCIPISAKDRKNISKIQLTDIGKFGLIRKERKMIPSHFHTGIDIKRPTKEYNNQPIFPIAKGIIISKRTDGPYAQLIIEHHINNKTFWTLYEHIAGISVDLNANVTSNTKIARFMNKKELNNYGWQFDHFHLEILKVKPVNIKSDKLHPDRLYNSFTLSCHKQDELEKYYYNPIEFLRHNLQ